MMGYVLHDTLPKRNRTVSWKTLFFFIILANLPDIDFLPGFIVGEPNRYHHHYVSHSLGASLVVGFGLALVVCFRDRQRFWSRFALFTSIYFSHIFLDYFSHDSSAPFGVPMFWPLTSEYFISPVPIFMSIQKSGGSGEFVQSLLVFHNLKAAVWEAVVFVPVLSIIKLVKNRTRIFRLIYEK